MSQNSIKPEKTEALASSPAKKVDWSNFRDHISTADPTGRRNWIYPRKVNGRFYRRRTWFSWLLLCVMFAGPFVTIISR